MSVCLVQVNTNALACQTPDGVSTGADLPTGLPSHCYTSSMPSTLRNVIKIETSLTLKTELIITQADRTTIAHSVRIRIDLKKIVFHQNILK